MLDTVDSAAPDYDVRSQNYAYNRAIYNRFYHRVEWDKLKEAE